MYVPLCCRVASAEHSFPGVVWRGHRAWVWADMLCGCSDVRPAVSAFFGRLILGEQWLDLGPKQVG
eukprot:6068062-Pyramimonas_sp.AAC.1